MRILASVARRMLILVIAVASAGVMGTILMRYAPGFGVDERELDGRLGAESIQRIRRERSQGAQLVEFLFEAVGRAAKGDLGESIALNQPITQLIKQRIPLTAGLLTRGIGAAIVLAIAAAGAGVAFKGRLFHSVNSLAASLALCLPVAFAGYLALWVRIGAYWVVALSVFPHLYRYTANLLEARLREPQLMAARSRGVASARILLVHIAWPSIPALAGSAGMTASIAFGSAVAIETVTGLAGVGQLAWIAASGRDLPLLLTVTVLAAAFILTASTLGDLLRTWCGVAEVGRA